MSKISNLDSISLGFQCNEEWDAMRGSEQVRFCSHCSKDVTNLSAMTRKEAKRLVRESGGKLCVRYVRRAPADPRPVFAPKLHQIARRVGITAGVIGTSLTLSTLMPAQTTPRRNDPPANVSQRVQPERVEGGNGFAAFHGFITDAQGVALPGANIAICRSDTKQEVTIAVADDNGEYRSDMLPVGTYDLRVSRQGGFGVSIREGVILDESGSTDHDFVIAQVQFVTMGIVALPVYLSPLSRAADDENPRLVRELISRGENVNGDKRGESPLSVAIRTGNFEITELLLQHGARPNARDTSKRTPIMAIDNDASAELVELLVKYGAKVNLADEDGNTPLMIAARDARPEVLAAILHRTRNIDRQNNDGRTALMAAAENDELDNVRILLEAGARVDLADNDGETALSLTTDEKAAELLRRYGAVDR